MQNHWGHTLGGVTKDFHVCVVSDPCLMGCAVIQDVFIKEKHACERCFQGVLSEMCYSSNHTTRSKGRQREKMQEALLSQHLTVATSTEMKQKHFSQNLDILHELSGHFGFHEMACAPNHLLSVLMSKQVV